jgi:hypothetical protein
MSNYATKEEALQSCLEVWQYLAETGIEYKADAYAALGKKRDVFGCAACEFAGRSSHEEEDAWCENCPLWDYHGRDCECERLESPYYLWCNGDDEEGTTEETRIHYAKAMVRLITAKIAANKKEKTK